MHAHMDKFTNITEFEMAAHVAAALACFANTNTNTHTHTHTRMILLFLANAAVCVRNFYAQKKKQLRLPPASQTLPALMLTETHTHTRTSSVCVCKSTHMSAP